MYPAHEAKVLVALAAIAEHLQTIEREGDEAASSCNGINTLPITPDKNRINQLSSFRIQCVKMTGYLTWFCY